jgi:hypothetical protein
LKAQREQSAWLAAAHGGGAAEEVRTLTDLQAPAAEATGKMLAVATSAGVDVHVGDLPQPGSGLRFENLGRRDSKDLVELCASGADGSLFHFFWGNGQWGISGVVALFCSFHLVRLVDDGEDGFRNPKAAPLPPGYLAQD